MKMFRYVAYRNGRANITVAQVTQTRLVLSIFSTCRRRLHPRNGSVVLFRSLCTCPWYFNTIAMLHYRQ